MNREATTLVDNVKQDPAEKTDASVLRGSARNISQPAASATTEQKRNFGDRIKGLFANLAKALEGDHGTQNYRN
jgi:hypothetical protein